MAYIKTAKRWLQVLEKSDVIFFLRPYSNNLLKRTVKTPKMYFFDTYLKKYLDALVVFNETMIGMQFLTDGISEQAVTKFIKIRKELQNVINKLEIEVISVKIMDSCEDNLSLSVIPKSLDFDCPQNSICQIDNCIVFLKGSNLPNEKIKVIVKK